MAKNAFHGHFWFSRGKIITLYKGRFQLDDNIVLGDIYFFWPVYFVTLSNLSEIGRFLAPHKWPTLNVMDKTVLHNMILLQTETRFAFVAALLTKRQNLRNKNAK